MDVETTFGFTTCLYEVRQLRYGPARVVRGKRASTGRFNQDTAMADLYRVVFIKEGPANPFPHSATTRGGDYTSVHREKKNYQQDQKKNRPL
jgi:hypothetical protein